MCIRMLTDLSFSSKNYVLGKALPSSQQLFPKAESISLVSCSKNLLGEEQIVKRFWGIPLFCNEGQAKPFLSIRCLSYKFV